MDKEIDIEKSQKRFLMTLGLLLWNGFWQWENITRFVMYWIGLSYRVAQYWHKSAQNWHNSALFL